MKFQITEEHLDKAVSAGTRISKCRACILAQAIKCETTEPVYVYKFCIEVGEQYCNHTIETNEIMDMFDDEEYDKIREMLPLELEIPII